MNSLDLKLIAALRLDSRQCISSLANRLGVSRATVRNHIEKLVSSGQIVNFTIQTRAEMRPCPVRAIMLIAIEGNSSDHVIARMRGLPEILAIYTTNGRWDIVAEIGADNLGSFDEILRRIRLFEGISKTETNILLASRKRASTRGI